MKKENNSKKINPLILLATTETDYELIDSGDGYKYERFGQFFLSRPDKEVIWNKNLKDWLKIDASYTRKGNSGSWKKISNMPESFDITVNGLKFGVKLTNFKHTGIFPEQVCVWQWLEEKVSLSIKKEKREIKALNLFGYTGGATMALSRAGASVVHVDASKVSVSWAKENVEKSKLSDNKIRWIVDDAILFLKREIKRGNKYDVIVMDPPAFGRGPKGEEWNIEKDFFNLISLCQEVLSDNPVCFSISGYSAGYSPIAYRNSILFLEEKYGGAIEHGELAIEETNSNRVLPAGMFARWSR